MLREAAYLGLPRTASSGRGREWTGISPSSAPPSAGEPVRLRRIELAKAGRSSRSRRTQARRRAGGAGALLSAAAQRLTGAGRHLTRDCCRRRYSRALRPRSAAAPGGGRCVAADECESGQLLARLEQAPEQEVTGAVAGVVRRTTDLEEAPPSALVAPAEDPVVEEDEIRVARAPPSSGSCAHLVDPVPARPVLERDHVQVATPPVRALCARTRLRWRPRLPSPSRARNTSAAMPRVGSAAKRPEPLEVVLLERDVGVDLDDDPAPRQLVDARGKRSCDRAASCGGTRPPRTRRAPTASRRQLPCDPRTCRRWSRVDDQQVVAGPWASIDAARRRRLSASFRAGVTTE